MKEYFCREMIEAVCPGGPECCDLIPRMPGPDVVMPAPIGAKCHTAEEYTDLRSFDRVCEFLKILIGRLA